MSGSFYLKKVNMILTEAVALAPLADLVEELGRVGIGCDIQLAEEPLERAVETLYLTDDEEVLRQLCRKTEEDGLPVVAWLRRECGASQLSLARYAFQDPRGVDAEYLERVYRRYLGLPWDILETPRCALRETTEEDVAAFWGIYKEPAITRYTESLYPTPEQERAYIREYIEKVYGFYEFGVWTIILKETGEIIGRAGLSVREGYELPELGYIIGVPWQRQGIALEVCSAILSYAWEEYGFERIQALIHRDNTPSLRLCERLGFRYERETEGDQWLYSCENR